MRCAKLVFLLVGNLFFAACGRLGDAGAKDESASKRGPPAPASTGAAPLPLPQPPALEPAPATMPDDGGQPQPATAGFCAYYGADRAGGETFPSIDGCNSCSCDGASASVHCTEIACPFVIPVAGGFDQALRYEPESDQLVIGLSDDSCAPLELTMRIAGDTCGKSAPWRCSAYLFQADGSRCPPARHVEAKVSLAAFEKRPAFLQVRDGNGLCRLAVVPVRGDAEVVQLYDDMCP